LREPVGTKLTRAGGGLSRGAASTLLGPPLMIDMALPLVWWIPSHTHLDTMTRMGLYPVPATRVGASSSIHPYILPTPFIQPHQHPHLGHLWLAPSHCFLPPCTLLFSPLTSNYGRTFRGIGHSGTGPFLQPSCLLPKPCTVPTTTFCRCSPHRCSPCHLPPPSLLLLPTTDHPDAGRSSAVHGHDDRHLDGSFYLPYPFGGHTNSCGLDTRTTYLPVLVDTFLFLCSSSVVRVGAIPTPVATITIAYCTHDSFSVPSLGPPATPLPFTPTPPPHTLCLVTTVPILLWWPPHHTAHTSLPYCTDLGLPLCYLPLPFR